MDIFESDYLKLYKIDCLIAGTWPNQNVFTVMLTLGLQGFISVFLSITQVSFFLNLK